MLVVLLLAVVPSCGGFSRFGKVAAGEIDDLARTGRTLPVPGRPPVQLSPTQVGPAKGLLARWEQSLSDLTPEQAQFVSERSCKAADLIEAGFADSVEEATQQVLLAYSNASAFRLRVEALTRDLRTASPFDSVRKPAQFAFCESVDALGQ